MSVPVIVTTSSVFGAQQYQPVEFIPYATNSPTGWTSTTLPTGLTIDAGTGVISGTPTVACPCCEFALVATNGDGNSEPVNFTCAVDPADPSATPGTGTGIELPVDLASGIVGSASSAPLVSLKRGDDIVFLLAFTKAGTTVDLTLTSLKFALKVFDPDAKEFDPDTVIVASAGLITFTANASTDLLTAASAHGLLAGYQTRFTTTGTLPAGLSPDTDYYVIASGLTSTACKVSATPGGAAIDITDTGAGIHSLDAASWKKTGSGSTARYQVHVQLAGAALEEALSNAESSPSTKYQWEGEFEFIEINPYDVGLATLRHSTQTFAVEVIRDLIPDV